MRRERRFVDAPQAAETLVPKVKPPIGGEDRDRLEQIVEGRGANAEQRVARARELHLFGLVFGDQQHAAVGGRLRDDVQVRAVAQQPVFLARLGLREPVDMRLPPFGIVAHFGDSPALAPRVEQPRKRRRLGHLLGLQGEQAAERQVREAQPLVGTELRHRRRQPVEQFALRVDEAAVRPAFGFELLNVDRIARDADHPPALWRERHIDDAHDPPFALDRHRNRTHLRRSRGARRVGGVGGAHPRDGLAQFDPAVDHRRRALRLDRANIGAVDERERQIGVAEPHREGCCLDQPRQSLERRHRLVALAARVRERLLAVGRIAQPQQHPARPADRLRRCGAMNDDRAVAAVGLQAQDKGLRAALRPEDRMPQRVMSLGIEPAAEPAKLVKIARPAFEPQPAPEPLARLDPPVGADDHGELRRRFDEVREPFGLPRDERRAPLHRDPAQRRPQSGEQPQRRKESEREQHGRGKRVAHPASSPRLSGCRARMIACPKGDGVMFQSHVTANCRASPSD